MAQLRIVHTWELPEPTLAAARLLVVEAFDGDFSDQAWEHGLGGLHVLLTEGESLVGHAAVVQRRLVHAGRALRCGYVEAVAVRADRRRHGYGGDLVSAIGQILRGAYEIGALSASEEGQRLYERHGWSRWRGPTSALTPQGVVATPADDGGVFVLSISVPLDRDAPLTCDWRDGEVW